MQSWIKTFHKPLNAKSYDEAERDSWVGFAGIVSALYIAFAVMIVVVLRFSKEF